MSQLSGLSLPLAGESLAPSPSIEKLQLLAKRRSILASNLGLPGPSKEELTQLLELAIRVPDHGKLAPWRFVVIEDAARLRLGAILESIFLNRQPDASTSVLAFERTRFERAPTVVTVISSPVEQTKVPEWEQVLSAGALCQNLLLAATAAGFGAQWLTEWYAYDAEFTKELGLEAGESIAGFIYIGTMKQPATERPRPEINNLVDYLVD